MLFRRIEKKLYKIINMTQTLGRVYHELTEYGFSIDIEDP